MDIPTQCPISRWIWPCLGWHAFDRGLHPPLEWPLIPFNEMQRPSALPCSSCVSLTWLLSQVGDPERWIMLTPPLLTALRLGDTLVLSWGRPGAEQLSRGHGTLAIRELTETTEGVFWG